MSDDSKLLLIDDIKFDGDKPAVEPTSLLSWARNSALYQVEQRMMTEKQLRDAQMLKPRGKFETTSPAQIKALGGNAVDRLLSFLHQRTVTDRAVPRPLMRFEAVMRKILSCYCDAMRGKGFRPGKLMYTQLA